LKYGLDKNFDAYAYNIKMTDTGSSFDIHTKDLEIHDIKTKLIGKLNIINIVGAVAVAANLGLTEDEIKAGIRFLQPVPHRLELIKNPNGSIIIDDAYNSNIEGAANAFQTLKKFQDKIRIIVTPGLVDLGEESFTYNKEFGKKAAGCADYYILVGEEPAKAIFEGLVEAGEDKDKICVVDNINEAITKYGEFDAEKRVVLLENDLPDNYL
jgi:UDP-N-acetylmuramoyl-tripeptide--D-alanyl-D-alanine ligase